MVSASKPGKKSIPPKGESDEMKIKNDPDFVALKRFDYSVKKLRDRYPDGAPDHVVAGALSISVEDMQKVYEATVKKLRSIMGVD
jgi:hypothetical protein